MKKQNLIIKPTFMFFINLEQNILAIFFEFNCNYHLYVFHISLQEQDYKKKVEEQYTNINHT